MQPIEGPHRIESSLSLTLTQSQLFVDQQMQTAECKPFLAGTCGIFSNIKPGDDRNEDAAALVTISAEHGVLIVADGAGGQPAGDQASRLAVEAMCQALQNVDSDEPWAQDAILRGFEQANEAVLDLQQGAATTLVVAEIQGNALRSYHAGDSLLLVTGQRSKLKHLTCAHSPVGYALHAGMLTEDEAIRHRDLHFVSNMVGTQDMHIEISGSIPLARFDTVILGSDGLFDNLLTREIVGHIRKGPLPKAMQELMSTSARRMQNIDPDQPSKPDDLTFAMFRPNAEPL